MALRSLGRIHSIFGQHVDSLNYHRESLKLQRKLGRKIDIAQGLVMLGEDLEIAKVLEPLKMLTRFSMN